MNSPCLLYKVFLQFIHSIDCFFRLIHLKSNSLTVLSAVQYIALNSKPYEFTHTHEWQNEKHKKIKSQVDKKNIENKEQTIALLETNNILRKVY